MTHRRRRDPRLPGPNMEDVETSVNGEPVASYGLSDVDTLIAAAHQDALERVRHMWGLDRDDWLLAAEELVDTHPELAKVILCRWCDIAVEAMEHDSREPSAWGFERLANLYHRTGDHGAEADILREFLEHWENRETPTGYHRIARRAEAGCGG